QRGDRRAGRGCQDVPRLLHRLPRPARREAGVSAVAENGHTVIAIDGPAASGKSSVARLLARRLGVADVSSGLLYRAATLAALQPNFDLSDETALVEMLGRHDVTLHADAHGNRVSIDGVDVTDELNTDTIDVAVSTVARHPKVRYWVTERLREVQGSFVID